MNVRPLAKFVNERYNIHVLRSAGQPPPWTKDPILQQYRFCNVRREDDRVTRWIHEYWLRPNTDDPYLWFAMAVARLINKPESLAECGYPVPWKKAKWIKCLEARKARVGTVFSGAYMIHAEGSFKEVQYSSKVQYLANQVLQPMWDSREKLVSYILSPEVKLSELHRQLMEFKDMGSFMAGQIIADTKWSKPLSRASDWFTFAAMGPGSRRGMSWVETGKPDTRYNPRDWADRMKELRQKLLPQLVPALRDLDAQNVQNCLCEYDKYQRVDNNLGRPKQVFKPSKETY